MTFSTTEAGAALDARVPDATTFYVGIAIGSTGLTTGDATSEATTAGYARQAVDFEDDPGNPRGKRNVSEVTVPFTDAVSGLSHGIVCTSAVEGTNDIRWFGAMSTTRSFDSNGGSIRFGAGTIKIQIP